MHRYQTARHLRELKNVNVLHLTCNRVQYLDQFVSIHPKSSLIQALFSSSSGQTSK